MELVVVEKGDPRTIKSSGEDAGLLSISQVREFFKERLKDGVYSVEGPSGEIHQFSLDRWTHRDPDHTFLQISFRTKTHGIMATRHARHLP